MADVALLSPATLPPTSGYSQVAIHALSGLAFISGQVGCDAHWRLAPGFDAQADLAFVNLATAVAACGATLHDVAKLTIFVRDARDLATYCTVRDRHFAGVTPLPASSFVAVAGLYDDAALIEIEAIVSLPPGASR